MVFEKRRFDGNDEESSTVMRMRGERMAECFDHFVAGDMRGFDAAFDHTYDHNGNTAGLNSFAAQTVTDIYDHNNRLIKRTASGYIITIHYDADGNRVTKTVNGATTHYLTDTQNPTGYAQVIEELQNNIRLVR